MLSAGGQLEDAVLAEVSGLDRRALREGVREAVASHIVVLDGDRYTLRHALVREAVHDDLLPGERAELHRALARALEARRGGRAERPARGGDRAPLPAAGDQPAALAAAVRAGAAAMAVQAYREGAALFERALELWDRVPDARRPDRRRRGRPARARRRLPLLRRRPRSARSRSPSARSRSSTRPPSRAARRGSTGCCSARCGRCCAATRRSRRSTAGSRCSPTTGRAPSAPACSRSQARMLMLQSRYHRAVGVARRALAEQAELADAGRPRTSTTIGALNALGVSLDATGEIEEGAAALRRALDAGATSAAHLQDIAAAAVNLSEALHRVGQHAPRRSRSRARRTRSSASLPTRQLWLALAIAQYAFDAGDWEAAEAALAEVGPAALLGRQLGARRPPAPRRAGARARRARDARARTSRARPSWRSTRASRSTSACSARCRRSSPTREGDIAGARAAVDEALDRIEFCSDDALRMAMVSAAGLDGRGDGRPARARPRRRRRRSRRRSPTPSCWSPACAPAPRTAGRSSRPTSPTPRPTTAARSAPTRTERWARRRRGAGTRWAGPTRPRSRAGARPRRSWPPATATPPSRPPPRRWTCAERLGAAWLAGELESLAARARLRLDDGDGDGPAAARGGRRRRRPVRPHPARAPGARARRGGRDEPRDRQASSTWRRRPPASTSRGSSRSSTCARAPRRPASRTGSGSTRWSEPARPERAPRGGAHRHRQPTAARAACSAVTPSSVASSAERGPSTSPARIRPGWPSSAAQSPSSGSRPWA